MIEGIKDIVKEKDKEKKDEKALIDFLNSHSFSFKNSSMGEYGLRCD